MPVTNKNLTTHAKKIFLDVVNRWGAEFTLYHFTGYKETTDAFIDPDYGIVDRTNMGTNTILDYNTYYVRGMLQPANQSSRQERWMKTIAGDIEYKRYNLYLYAEDTGGNALVYGTNINSDDQVIDIHGTELTLDTCQPYTLSGSTVVYYKCRVTPKIDKKER